MKTSILVIVLLLLMGCNNPKSIEKPNPTSMTHPVKNIHISINRPKADVYGYASNPENFPQWLGFLQSISKTGNNLVWVAETNLGKIQFELTPQNDFGVIDQIVTLPDGTKVNNPMRVIDNGNGSEVIFTLLRMPDKTDKDFADDAKSVENDLKKLKEIMEQK